MEEAPPPPPSPLAGCYLLIVVGEPRSADHRDAILGRVAKGFLSWDVESSHVDLEKELQALTSQAPEGEEARNGERLIQYATENLVTEVLIHPQVNTLVQCVRNLLSSFTRHRHLIHAGYTFAGTGSWVLQDGTFSLADLTDAFQETEVQRVLRAYEHNITIDVHCAPEGDWTSERMSREPFSRYCKVRINPDDRMTAGGAAIGNFINYLSAFVRATPLEALLQPSDVVGNIRFSHPTLYVFPGGQGDAALFGINGFNMLVDGGFARKACFWDFVRHLDRLDAVLVTRLNNGNVNGMSAVLRRKQDGHVYPQIGHFFCNLQERKHAASPDGDKDRDPLLIDLTVEAHEMVLNLHHLSLRPHACYSSSDPINLYHKVGHGKLDMYVLSPARDSRDLKEFLARWNTTDTSKIFSSGGRKSSASDFAFPLQNLVSICALLVWQPANPNDTITRILFPGSAPQHKIFEGIEKLRHLQFLRYPVCSAKSLSPSTSAVTISSRKQQLRSAAPAVIDKLLPGEVAKQQASPPSKPVDKAAPKSATIPVTGVEKPVQPVKTVPPSAAPPTAAPAAAPPQVLAAKPTPPPPKAKPERLPAKTEPPKTKTEIVKTADTEKLSSKVDKTSKAEVVRMKAEHKSKTETKTSTVKTRTETKSTRSTERKAQRTTITTSGVTEKKTDVKSSPTTPKKSVEHKVNGVAPKLEPVKHARPSSRTRPSPTSTPAKSAKEANNRKVVESKYHFSKASKLTTSKAAKKEVQEPAAKAERKPVSRRPKVAPSSPAKIAAKSPGSPAKSSSAKSTPTPSVKSEKDAVIRRRKPETGKITTDSSAVSTPSTAEVETVVKAKETGVVQETPLVNGHVSEMIITKEEISKDHLDKPLEETYVEKKIEKIDSETTRKSPTDGKQEVTGREDEISIKEKAMKETSTKEEKEKQVDEGIEEKESEVKEKQTVVEDKESEIEEKETELEEKESEIEEKESELEEGDESRQLMHEKDDIEATEEEQTEEIEDDEGPVDIKESLHAELETEVRKLMGEKVEGEGGGGEEEEEEEEEEGVGGVEEEEEEQEEDQEGEEDEEDEYLIVEKEDVESYQEQESIESHLPDDFDNKDIDVEEEDEGELKKHLLDEAETEKTKKDIEKEETFTKIHREVESEKEHLLKEKEADITLKSKAEKEITETEKMKEEHVKQTKGEDRVDVIEQTAKPLKEEITKDHIEEKVEEIISSAKEIVTKGKYEDERKPGVSQDSDKDIQKEELSESKKEPETSEDIKEISSISPEEKIDISSEKVRETTDTDHKLDDGGHVMKDIPSKEIPEQKFIAEESQPDEKVSTTIESAATTAPTLPEDERIPLDEIKEIVEEKYVKEETKEKEKPVAESITRLEQPTTLPQVVMPIFETHIAHGIIHHRDIVKTPDEVADLPVHEEVDPGMYDADDFVRDFHKTKYEVQLSKKQQDTEDMKDRIFETGAKEEGLQIDAGKADTLKESLKQFEDEKEVEEVKIVPKERFIDVTEDIKHIKSEIPDVSKTDVTKPSVKPVSVTQLEEHMSKEDMVKPTDDSKPVTMISEEQLLEASFQTYTDLKATQEKVDELKEKFSEEAKKAIEKEIDYAAISEKDIAHDKVALEEMKEETREREKICAQYTPSEKKSVEEQLETTSDELKEKEKEKVISEDIATLQQTEEEKIKDEKSPLAKNVAEEKVREQFITEDVTEGAEKQEADKVVSETKIEKEAKEDQQIVLKEMVDDKKQDVVTEDITEEVEKLEDKQKPAEQEVFKKQTKDVEEVILKTMVEGMKESDEKTAVTEGINTEVKKVEEQEIFSLKEIGEKESKTKDENALDGSVMKLKEEDSTAEIKKVEDKEKPVPKEVTQEVILKDDKILSEELVKEKKKQEEENLITEDDSEEFKKQKKDEVDAKEVFEEAIKEKEVTKEMAEKQTKEERFIKEDITEEIKQLEEKPTPKEEDKIISKETFQAEKKEEKVVTEDTLTTTPKLEDRDKDLSKEVEDTEQPSQKEAGEDESKEEKVDLKEMAEEEKTKRREDIAEETTKLEDQQKVTLKEVDEGKAKDRKEEEMKKDITEETEKEMVELKEQEKLVFKDAGKEKPTDVQKGDKPLKELEVREKLSPKEVEVMKISKEEIPEKKSEEEEEEIAITKYTIDETERLGEKEKIHPKEMVQDKAKEGDEVDSKEFVDVKKKDKIEALTEDETEQKEKQEKDKPSPKEIIDETTVREEESVLTKAIEKDKSIKADIAAEIKKPQEMEELVSKDLVVDMKTEGEEKKKTVTEDVTEGLLKPEEKAKPVAKETDEEEVQEEEKLVSKEEFEEHKGDEKETVVTEDITEKIKQLQEKEKPTPTEISELKTKEEDTLVLKDKIGEKEGDDRVITEDGKEKAPLEEKVEIKAKEEIITTKVDEKKKEEEKDKSVLDDITVKAKELEEKEIVPKETDEEREKVEKYITSQNMADENIEEKEEDVPAQITEEITKLDAQDILLSKEMSKEKHREEGLASSKETDVEKLIESTEKVVPEVWEHIKKTEEKDIGSSKEEVEDIIHQEWEIVSKELIEEEKKDETSKVVTEETISEIKKVEEKEKIIPEEIDKEKIKEADKTAPRDTMVKKGEEEAITEDITEAVKRTEEKEKSVPHETPEENVKEAEKTAPKDTMVKMEEEKMITEIITAEVKKTDEKEKPVSYEIPQEKPQEAEKTVPKDAIVKREEEKVITEAITEEVKKTEEKEEPVPHEIPEEKAKEAVEIVPKDTMVKREVDKVVTEDITLDVKKPEEKEKPVLHEISEEKPKEAEKTVPKHTILKKEEEKVVTEGIIEEVKKPEEKEQPLPHEIPEEKAKKAEKTVPDDTILKKEEEKVVTEGIIEEDKKSEEKEKAIPHEIPEEKAKEEDKTVPKDTIRKKEEGKVATEGIIEEVKKSEEKEKPVPHEIPEEKAKEAEKSVPKDTILKKEEEKIVTEGIIEGVKKSEEKEKPVPYEIPEEKAKEAEKSVPKDTVVKKEEEKVITEGIIEEVKKPEEKEKPVPYEIPEEKAKKPEEAVPKDSVVKKEEEKVTTEGIIVEVKKPEEKVKPVPHEIPEEKPKEAAEIVPKDIMVEKEEDKVITEDITAEVKKPEEKEKPVPYEIPEEKAKEPEEAVPKDSAGKKEEEKVTTEGIIVEVKKPEEKVKPVPHEVPEEKAKEAAELVPKDVMVKKEEDKVITEDITAEVKETEEKEQPVPYEIPEEKAKEPEEAVPKDSVVKKEEEKVITEGVIEELQKPEEKEKHVSHGIPEEKEKEAEKTVPKDTILKKEEEKVVTEGIFEEVRKSEEKEIPVTHEIPEEKAKGPEEVIPKDSVVKKKEEKVTTEGIIEEVKKPEEKEKPVPQSVPEEKAKEPEEAVPKDSVVKKDEQKVTTEGNIVEVKKSEEKVKPVPHEIPKEKAKEAVEIVPKDIMEKKEEEKVITEYITAEVKKPEEKDKRVPHEISEEKLEEAEKTVPKDKIVKKEEEKVITEDIIKEVKISEEKEKPVPHEIPEEKAKEAADIVPKDIMVKKEEEKVITEDITEEVKKPEETEKPVPHEIPEEKTKEAEKTVPKDTVVKKEDEMDITEGIIGDVKETKEMEKPVPHEIPEERVKEVLEKRTDEKDKAVSKEPELFGKDIVEVSEDKSIGVKKEVEGKLGITSKDLVAEKEYKEEYFSIVKDKEKQKDLAEGITKPDEKQEIISKLLVEGQKEGKEILTDEKKKQEYKIITEESKKDTISKKDEEEKEKDETFVTRDVSAAIAEKDTSVSKDLIKDKKETEKFDSKDLLGQMETDKKRDSPEDAIREIEIKEELEDETITMDKTEKKKKYEGKERATTDVIKEKEVQETGKIVSEHINGEVGTEETTAGIVLKDVVEEKEEDSLISKDVAEGNIDDQERISGKIKTVVSSSDISDSKVVKGEPDEKVGQKVELEKETIKAPSALSATYLEIIDKLQKEEPSKIDEQEDKESPKRDQPEVLEADKYLHQEEPKPIEKSEEISIKPHADIKSEIKMESGVQKEERKEYTPETEKVIEKVPTDTTVHKQQLQKEISDDVAKEIEEPYRKEEDQLLAGKPSLQEEKLVTEKDKLEIGVEKGDKKVKVETDSGEAEKPSMTVEWLTCVVKDTKPPLGGQQEEIFKKMVSVDEKKISETVDQTDEKKVKEIKDEVEKVDKLIEKTLKDTELMPVITEQQKSLPDGETSKELPTSIYQKKQPVGETLEELIDEVKSQPKYEADRTEETLSEMYLEDNKDELTKTVSSGMEKQLTDEEEKKLKTEKLFSETESSIISKDLPESITTTVMKEYILKTTHITSDSVISDLPAPEKMPLQTKETGLLPKAKDTDKRDADTTKEFRGLRPHELKDSEKMSAVQDAEKVKQDVHEPISVSSAVIEKTGREEETPYSEDVVKEMSVKSTPHIIQQPSQMEREMEISQETTTLKMKEVSKEVKDDRITSKPAISAAGHRSDDEDGEPPPSPGEDYIDSGMEEEPVYTKLDAPELPEYVTVTPDSTPASPKALPFKTQVDSAKTPLSGSEEKEGKEKLKYEYTAADKKELGQVATTAIAQEIDVEDRMYVDEAYDKTGETREVYTDKDGQTVIRTKTEYKTVVTREGKPDEKVTSYQTAASFIPVSSGEITTYTTVVKDDKLSDEEHLEETDDDSKESVSEETFIDEDGRTVTRKIVRRYKTIVTSKTESADGKSVTQEIQPSFSSGGRPGSDIHVSSGEITTYTTVVKDDKLSDEEHLEEIDDDSKESVSEETFTDEDGRTVTRKIVRHYKTVVTSKTKADDEKDVLIAKEIQPSFSSEAGPTLPSSSKTTTTTTTKIIDDHEYPLDADAQDGKAAVTEETFTDKDGRIVTRSTVQHHKTYITQSTEDLEHTHIKIDVGTPPEPAQDIGERKTYSSVCTEEGSIEKIKDSDGDDEKESVIEETFTDEEGRTVIRKVIRKYKTVIRKESEVPDEKPAVKLVTTTATTKTESKESDDIDDGVEMEECTELGDQDENESVSEETFTDENGKIVTRRIVRRYKTVVTRGGESVDTKDSTQLAPKEGESIGDGTETGQTDLDDQDEKESVSEETFTDENGRTVTRKIVRRYKTVVTKESSSVSAKDSSQITASELSPSVLKQKTYTTVIKSDDDRDDGVETDKLDEFDDQDEKETVSEETFTDENGRTVRRKIIRHYKTVVRQVGEPMDEKDSTTIKMERISDPELISNATTSKCFTAVMREGGDEDDGIEISDQDGKESVSEETFTDENGRIVTRKIVRRYKTVLMKESGSLEDKSTSELGKDLVRDLERTSTAITTESCTTALDDVERYEHTDFDDQDEKESVTEETFTDENGRTVTRKIVRQYKTVVTKESELPDEKDTSQLEKVLESGSELPTTTILRKIYTTVTKDGEGAEDGLGTEHPDHLDDQDGKEYVTEETFTDESGRTVTRKIVKRYKTAVTTEGEDVRGDISSDNITDKVLSTKEIQLDPDKQEEKSTAFCSFATTESKSDILTDITEGEDGKDSVIEETFTGEDGSVVTRKITRQYKTVLKKETGSDDQHFTTKISTGSTDPSLPLTTTTMTKTYTTVTKQGDDYSDDLLEELGKAHEPSGATSKTTTTVTTITKRISSKDGEEEITEATTEEVTSEDGKEQSTVTVTTKRDEHGDMVVHTSITPRDKEIDSYSISGPVSFISSDKKGEHSAHSTVSTTVMTPQMTTEAWKTGRKHDLQQCDSDQEDDPSSPLSITSQVAHSPPSHFGFETSGSPTTAELYSPKGTSSQKVSSSQMTSSFYGSPLTGEEQLTSTDDKLDFQRALHEHREARGEDLQSAFHSLPQHKTVTMGFKEGTLHGEQLLSGINGQKYEDIDSKGDTTKTIPSSSGVTASTHKIPPVITSTLPAEHDRSTQKETAGDKQKDPIGSWGKPLGLPAPAPPPANTITTNGEVNTATKPGTPKKEKKAMQMKKNLVMNENNKTANAQSAKESKSRRSESPVKQKNVSNKDVGKSAKVPGGHIYIDLTYVPHHGNSYYTNVEFFKRVRARYYVFSGTEPSRDVYNALLEAKQTWEDKDLEVTIIPTYDTDTLGYWVAENEDLLTKYKIDLSPSASRCTINLQDHETSCSAYRLEF